ncbi:hypothetical protein [Paracoccus ravus]|nr:hypothetical protein [Paracoccus ravus]
MRPIATSVDLAEVDGLRQDGRAGRMAIIAPSDPGMVHAGTRQARRH